MKYYLIAGEASGDLHGSNLMRGLYAQDPSADIRFWGGDLMNAVYREHQTGKGLVKDYREGAVMGFMEVLRKGGSLLRRVRFCKDDILAWKPDAVVLIDYPGFNFKMAEFAHKAGFKVFYYIAPKVWASREGRIRKLKAFVDKLFIVFPFEKPYFESKGVPFVYAGNPLVDAIDRSPAMKETREAFLQRTGLPDAPWIALLAGSRSMEIKNMMPVLVQFADAWHQDHPDFVFVVAAAPSRSMEDYAQYLGGRNYVKVVFGETYGALRHARAAVINSGTASLEAALIGTPQVVGYRVNPVSAAIMLRLIKVKYISLANLIIDRLAFKELLQNDLTAGHLREEMTLILENAEYRGKMLDDYARVRSLLGGTGASEAVAKAMVQALQ
ncbi:MAG: lipid-A-disaccharide synthase [Bacteroidales bacterium]|nr:lipid-A-disaccharide synthase [Bacteroidales bacterium]